MSEPIHILSLGAGVQSSTLALMAAEDEVMPMPHCAIFADTQAEPRSVYSWLDWLERKLPFPVLRVTKGSLTDDALKMKETRDKRHIYTQSLIPAYTLTPDGTKGHMQRTCTYDYKVLELTKHALRIMKAQKASFVIQWIGISVDEAHRMKPSRDHRIQHRWPLVDMRIRRDECLTWMQNHGYPRPPRSACVYCPFHSDQEWRRLKVEEPEEFQRAVQFEKDLQEAKGKTTNMDGVPFLHNSRTTLDKVDFSTDEDHGQLSLFGNECSGLCGV